METPLLKRRLNPFLLISTVLVLSLLAGMSVVYQSQLHDLVSSKNDLGQELEEKNERIEHLESQSSNLSSRLSTLNKSLEKSSMIIEEEREAKQEKQDIIESLNASLENKTAFIQNQSETLQQYENLSVHVSNINDSLSFICSSDSNLTSGAESECQDWGY